MKDSGRPPSVDLTASTDGAEPHRGEKKAIRIEAPFALDDAGRLRFAPPEAEPLKTAVSLTPPAPPSDLCDTVYRESTTARDIERRSVFHRLEAAIAADVDLFRTSQHYIRRRNTTGSDAARLVTSLTVWAWTRSRLGLYDDSAIAMYSAFEWADTSPSSLRAFTLQRSARLELDQLLTGRLGNPLSPVVDRLFGKEVLSEAREAVDIQHRLTEVRPDIGRSALIEATLDYGKTCCLLGRPDHGHELLVEGLEELEAEAEATPSDRVAQLDARSVLARSFLQLGRLEEAFEAAEPIDPDHLEPRDRYLWLHLRADLHRASGHRSSAFARRLEALAVALDLCGPERVLDDLTMVGRDRPDVPEFSMEAEEVVTDAVRLLTGRLTDEAWRRDVRTLARAVLADHSPKKRIPIEELRHQLTRALQRELCGGDETDDRTTEFSDA